MKKNRHSITIENSNVTEQLFLDNETKTNRMGGWCILAITCLTAAFGIPISLNLVKTDFVWGGWYINGFCFIEAVLFMLLRVTGYEDKKAKYFVFIGLILIGGATQFLYPLASVFLFCCPILLSVKYYNPRLTVKVSLITWVTFILTVFANVLLDSLFLEVHNLHMEQGMTLWMDIPYTVEYYTLPRSAVYLIEAVLARHIAVAGKNMVMRQAEISSKAASLSAELSTASKIQSSSLPAPDFVTPDKRILLSAGVSTARDVGGDFYDYFMINDHLLVIAVADVSDKGLPAAMYAVEAQSYLRFAFFEGSRKNINGEIEYVNLEEIINAVNRQLVLHNMDDMFVTMWVGCFDTRTGAGKYINAGHNRPYIVHGDGTSEWIVNTPQFFLGAFEDAGLRSGFLRLRENDVLTLYTDGVTDARNIGEETFGEKRLQEVLIHTVKDEGKTEPMHIKNEIGRRLEEFMGDARQYDDITLMTLLYNGADHSEKIRLELETGENAASRVMDFINSHLEGYDCPPECRRNLDVIIDEICSNISDYAYKGEKGPLWVEAHLGKNFISVRFEDKGEPFNPVLSEDPDLDGEPRIGGLGIYLVKKLSDELRYKYEDGKNKLTIYKIWNM